MTWTCDVCGEATSIVDVRTVTRPRTGSEYNVRYCDKPACRAAIASGFAERTANEFWNKVMEAHRCDGSHSPSR